MTTPGVHDTNRGFCVFGRQQKAHGGAGFLFGALVPSA